MTWLVEEGEMRFARLLMPMLLCCAAAGATAEQVRPSALAGAWYPADPAELTQLVDGLLDGADGAGTALAPGELRALIVPHAGYVYSGPTAGQGYALLTGRSFRRVLVLAPSHHGAFPGLSIAAVDAYRTPLGDCPLDREVIGSLRASSLVGNEPEADAPEHAIEIQLPFLQRALAPGWRLVPVLVGQLSDADLGRAAELLRPLADAATLVVVSSDFTHYGPRFDYRPFPLDAETPARLAALDGGAIDRILAKDGAGFSAYQRKTGDTICGYQPIGILLRMLGPQARVTRIAYTTSGALTGDYANSVSYAVLAVTDPQTLATDTPTPPAAAAPTDEQLKQLHRLANLAVADAVLPASDARTAARDAVVAALPESLRARAGAFVTLKRHGDLRGCIGTIEPIMPLYEAVLDNGDHAARRDPRFLPVRPAELADLEVEVSVLSPQRPIASWEAFRIGEEGIILSKNGQRAVFLPEVATEQGWTREETLTYLSRKAGLPPDAWRSGADFAVFTTTKYTAPYAVPE
jgi:MEMO1 family protein